MCVYLLAKDLFGARFIKRLETSRGGNRSNGGMRCYNFQTDKSVVDLAIDLIDWRHWDLESFQPEIVQKYNPERPCETMNTDVQSRALVAENCQEGLNALWVA